MQCPRCNSKSYVHIYIDDIKCMACSHTEYKIPSDISKEVKANLGSDSGNHSGKKRVTLSHYFQ